jgi:hypothetical protein
MPQRTCTITDGDELSDCRAEPEPSSNKIRETSFGQHETLTTGIQHEQVFALQASYGNEMAGIKTFMWSRQRRRYNLPVPQEKGWAPPTTTPSPRRMSSKSSPLVPTGRSASSRVSRGIFRVTRAVPESAAAAGFLLRRRAQCD